MLPLTTATIMVLIIVIQYNVVINFMEAVVFIRVLKLFLNYNFSLNKYYTIKVDVSSNEVDVYIDDEYITSTIIENKGDELPKGGRPWLR